MTVRRDLRLLLFAWLLCGFILSRATVGYAQTAPAPDLVVESITIGNVDADGNYPVSATVKNQGNAPTPPGPILIFVEFWFSTDSVLNPASDTALPPSPLPPIGLAPDQTASTPPISVALPGPGYVIAVVDSSGQIPESNEANNTLSRAFAPAVADLIPTSVTAPAVVDVGTYFQPEDIRWTVRNQGDGPAGPPAWVDEYHLSVDTVYGGSDDFYQAARTIPDGVVPLAPGTNYTTGPATAFAVPLVPAGTYYLVFRTNTFLGNPNGSIGEGPGGLDNNTYAGTVPIQIRVPDLRVTAFSVSPGAVEPEDSLSFSYTVTNDGDAPAFRNIGGGGIGWTDALQLSRDATYEDAASADTVFLSLVGANGPPTRLEPGDSYTVTGTLVVPTGAETGDWYVLVKTDNNFNAGAARFVYEGTGEENNVLAANAGATLRVGNRSPETAAGGPYTVNEGGTVEVSGSASDPEGDAVTYAWDLDNDGSFETPGQAATFSAAAIDGPATRTAVLRACDAFDVCATSGAEVQVGNVDPTARFDAPTDVEEGGSITIRLLDPTDPSGIDAAAGFHYAFACHNGDLSDKTYANASSEDAKVCTGYDDGDGATTVKGRIIDKDGGFTEYSATLTVHNVAPTATLSAPSTVDAGQAIALSLTGVTDPSSADTSAGFTYAFDCGDGVGFGAFGAGTGVTCPTSTTGTRTVAGRIRDKDGGESTYTASVTINPVAPAVYAARVQPPINFDGSSVFKASRGVVPVKFALTADGAPTCDLPLATIVITRTSGSVVGALNESVYSTPADSGSAFRIADCQYAYNLSAPGLGPGVYRVDIVINGAVVGSATFELK